MFKKGFIKGLQTYIFFKSHCKQKSVCHDCVLRLDLVMMLKSSENFYTLRLCLKFNSLTSENNTLTFKKTFELNYNFGKKQFGF